MPFSKLAGHAIVGGFGHLGSRVVAQLRARGCEVVVIDREAEGHLRPSIEALGARPLGGDLSDDYMLEHAYMATARCYIATTGSDQVNLESAITARRLAPQAAIVVSLFDQTLARRVENAFSVEALSSSFLASPAFTAAATTETILAIFDIEGCHLSFYDGPTGHRNSPGLAIVRRGGGLAIAPPAEVKPDEPYLTATMRLPEEMDRRLSPAHHQVRLHRPWRERLQLGRVLRALARRGRRAATITKALLLTLLAVVLISVNVFTLAGGLSPLDAVYFVITTLTTTGYGDITLRHAPAGLKLYGILLMLAGTGLLAALYAIIADYIIAARVESLLGRQQVHLRDHIVVVGLGKVGFRVAYDLSLLGETVVGVEANDDLDNVQAARTMFPVVIGNAARESILLKAGIKGARVVIAATDDPMVNLSVALHARERNPRIKTVVRTYGPDLAAKLESFNLDVVLSTSAIAAPAFVDAALYPGVEGSFRWGEEDALVTHCEVQAGSPLAGKSVAEVGEGLGIAVLLLGESGAGQYRLASLDTMLQAGDRLVALVGRSRLAALRGM